MTTICGRITVTPNEPQYLEPENYVFMIRAATHAEL
jgi:hypothetical protein